MKKNSEVTLVNYNHDFMWCWPRISEDRQ